MANSTSTVVILAGAGSPWIDSKVIELYSIVSEEIM